VFINWFEKLMNWTISSRATLNCGRFRDYVPNTQTDNAVGKDIVQTQNN